MTSTLIRKPSVNRALPAVGMGAMAWLLGAFSATPAAHANAGDDAFLTALKGKGINFESPDAAVNSAHAVCHELDAGQTPEQVANDVLSSSKLDGYHAGYFVGLSIKAYCPKYAAAPAS
ncbi:MULTISPECIES: DUF732 domain-containing protein [unclassified Mycobacterium]|uniref:DUF732 domain-containing protein n=1 Tax=unclassified Mycobacterium TaxID=2642494 RepID=UPI0007FD319F|nr:MULTISPECIES: DUF732 domain-containing protein [unclassified Mycobacterium]OBG75756.1 hypothetical protein A5700_01560 [Mycobacterium sp. E1214]OBH29266.1 hypothetical protein A5693_20145 [Mycobacterium sp. E1319]